MFAQDETNIIKLRLLEAMSVAVGHSLNSSYFRPLFETHHPLHGLSIECPVHNWEFMKCFSDINGMR